MEDILYEITKSNFQTLSNHYNFDIGYLDEDNIYKVHKSFLDKLKSQNFLLDLELMCTTLLSKSFSEVFIDSSIHNYIANNEKEIDYKVPFDKFFTYELHANAILDLKGDVVEVHYKKDPDSNIIAISEFREHIREVSGIIPNDEYILRRVITVKFFKFDGSYTEKIFDRVLNEYERKKLDSKSRRAVIDSVKSSTGDFIINFYMSKVASGEIDINDVSSTIMSTSIEALSMIESLNDQISAYRDDRENGPLVNALNSYPRTNLLVDEIINFIRDSINITFYNKID